MLMTFDQLSEYLNIPKSTLYKLSCQRLLPKVKIQGNVRFDQAQIDEWIRRQSVPALQKDHDHTLPHTTNREQGSKYDWNE